MTFSKHTPCCCGDDEKKMASKDSSEEFSRIELLPVYRPKNKVGLGKEKSSVFFEDVITGFIDTPSGRVPLVGANLGVKDILGSWKARWGIGRMRYRVRPGIYGIGRPDENSPVFITANYKMSFDRLRKSLSGLDGWIMVLDTDGINVWCAAGKGTFGTEELISRIEETGLKNIVSHRTIILPQLGAPGVSAYEVRMRTGFKVIYGPVRAQDIKRFLDNGMKATEDMRLVRFGLMDRLVLIPMELVQAMKYSIPLAIIALFLHTAGIIRISLADIYPLAGAIFAGCAMGPVLLPWLPGKAFSLKGWFIGLLWAITVVFIQGFADRSQIVRILSILLLLPAISAFLTLNFTGASTYTSLSGVKKEMKIAMPLIILSAMAGIGIRILDYFTGY